MRGWAVLAFLWCVTAPALAQNPGTIGPPPVRQSIDDNGVDVLRGKFYVTQTDVTIGPADGGLSYRRFAYDGVWSSDEVATLDKSGNVVTVTLDGTSDSFTQSGTQYSPTEGNGASLEDNGATFRYVSRTGTVAIFTSANNEIYSFYKASLGRVSTVTWPNGLRQTYTYKQELYCGPGWENGTCPVAVKIAARLQSVTNNRGYQLKFSYASNNGELDVLTYRAWVNIISTKAINNGVEYCAPDADSCTLSNAWPTATYADTTNGIIATDPLNRATRYLKTSSPPEVRIKRPGALADNIVVGYGANGVSLVLREGIIYNYAYSDAGSTRTTTVTDPAGKSRVYVGDTTSFLLASYRDELNRLTQYAYDTKGRLKTVTYPEGNITQYTYDVRGNLTETRAIAKPGSGAADIVTTNNFAATCTNPVTCNKPQWLRDAKLNQTDFTYDATHGGLLTVTAPPPTSGAIRPQTRYGYQALNAYYRQSSSGGPVTSAQPIMMLTGISACQTGASCVGTADEVRSTIAYGPQMTGTPNNLLPVSVSSGAGDASLTATTSLTYDSIANRVFVDGPLSGAQDTSRMIYDAARQMRGVIGPDPDGGGPMPNRAQRIGYNLDGQITSIERGTTNGQTDAAWAAFSAAESVARTYDGNARSVSDALVSGGTTYAFMRYGYDSLGRIECVATRMDPAQWAGQTDACLPQTGGPNGPDRIVRTSYDAAGQVTKTTAALGTAEEADDATMTFTPNGRAQTLTDANGFRTTYEYDGFDRLAKTRYPLPLTPGSSSTTDYDGHDYDPNGNVVSHRLRDAQSIGFTYDALDRNIFVDLSGSGSDQDITNSYDLLGRLKLSVDTSGHRGQFDYDALGRVVNETTTYGPNKHSDYDLAGRRTRLTWGDGFFVDYDYLVTGEVIKLRENGANSGAGVLGTYGYDSLGRRTSLTRGNGIVTGWAYDPVSRLQTLTNDLAATAQDLTLGFAYNPASQITNRTASNDAYAWTQHSNRDVVETPNGLNQLTARTPAAGSPTALSYDGRGNAISVGATSYSYGQRNQLFVFPNGALFYDPLNRADLIYKSSDGTGTAIDYDGAQASTEFGLTTGAMLRRYVTAPGDNMPLVWYEGSGTTDRRWLIPDERGSVIAVTNGSGVATAINSYDAYGTPAATNAGRFGYTGQYWLGEAELWNYRARLYHPVLGRFMQTDPIGYGDGVNWYAYVGGDPVNRGDPSGLCTLPSARSFDKVATPDKCGPKPDEVVDPNTIVVTGTQPTSPISTNYLPVALPSFTPIGVGDLRGSVDNGNAVNPTCAYSNASGQCVYVRDKKGKLQLSPDYQKQVCANYDVMMRSNSQVGAAAGAAALPGVVNAGTGGAIGPVARLTARLGGAFTTFIAGVTGLVTGILGFTPPPPGCK